MNNALMGILRVKDLSSPPYLTITPSASRLQVQPEDKFVVIGSDGLFDFFTNEEVVEYVHKFLVANPTGDPAKYMVDQLLLRAAHNAGTNSVPSLPSERDSWLRFDDRLVSSERDTDCQSYPYNVLPLRF